MEKAKTKRSLLIFAAVCIACALVFSFVATSSAREQEASAGAQLSAKTVENKDVYRLYNQYTGEHLYTLSADEYDALGTAGWTQEGTSWVAPETSETPVYRLYNQYTSDHHYTKDENEYKTLGEIGWTQEGTAFYSDDAKGKPIFRTYNPYVEIGSHHLTSSAEEYRTLANIGWTPEGVAFYGVDPDANDPLPENAIKFDIEEVTFDGTAKTPKVTIEGLTEGEDFEVVYPADMTSAGEKTITIVGIGKYSGEVTKTFTIDPKTFTEEELNSLAVDDSTQIVFDGSEKKPAITGSILEGLKEGTDYDVTYENATDASTEEKPAKATITFKGNYSGTKTLEFTISPREFTEEELNTLAIDAEADVTYDGTEKTPAISGSILEGLEEGKDYTVTYNNSTNVSDEKATATIEFMGNYKGKKTIEFEVQPKTFTEEELSSLAVDDSEEIVFDGSEKKPAITGSILEGLEEGKDYDVVYANNENAGEEATATITFKGNYKGETTINFTIAPKTFTEEELSDLAIDPTFDTTYTGDVLEPSVTSTVLKSLEEGTDYEVSYSNNKNAGDATATITFKGNYAGTAAVVFTISPKTISDELLEALTVDPSFDLTYTGNLVEPTITGEAFNDLKKGTDYTIIYENNKKIGDEPAKAKVEFIGNYSGKTTIEFTIKQRELTVVWQNRELEYNATPRTPNAILTNIVGNDDVKVSGYTGQQTDAGEGYKAEVSGLTGDDAANYTLPADKSVIFQINKKEVKVSGITASAKEYDGTTNATIDVSNVEFGGLETADAGKLSLDSTKVTGAFESKDVPTTKKANATITYAEGALSGDASKNYKLNTTDSQTTVENVAFTAKKVGITWDPEDASYTYDGTAHAPTATVTSTDILNNEAVTPTVVYSKNGEEVQASECKNAGSYLATVTGVDNTNYALSDSATISKSFIINGKALKGAEVALGPTLTYNAAEQTQTISRVTDIDGIELTADVDYEIKNAGNKATTAGDHTFNIVGKGNYTGETTVNFNIAQLDINDADVTLTENNLTYNGGVQTQGVKSVSVMTADAKTVTLKSADYTLSGDTTVTNAGNYLLTLTGTGNCKGKKTASFSVAQFDLSSASVDVEYSNSLTYDGTTQTQNVKTVTVSDTMSLTSADYDLKSNTAKNAGSYKLEFAGKGNFTGSAYAQFVVGKKSVSFTWSEFNNGAAYTYDGKDHATVAPTAPTPIIDTGVSGETLKGTASYTLNDAATTEVVKAGTYTAKMTDLSAGEEGTDPNNYTFDATETKTFKIDQLEAVIAWGDTELKYDGSAQAPTATVSNLQRDTDDVTVEVTGKQTEVGTYTGTNAAVASALSGDDAGNYTMPATTQTCDFEIARMWTVTFYDMNSTTKVDGVDPINVKEGQTFNAPNPEPTKDGYVFRGWFTNEECTAGNEAFDDNGVSKATATANVSIYAKWTNAQVTFDANAPSGTTATVDGKNATKTVQVNTAGLTSEDVPASSAVTLSDATYEFAGWGTTPGAGTDEAITSDDLVETTLSKDTTYYAIWKDTNTSDGFWMSNNKTKTVIYESGKTNEVPDGSELSDFNTLGNYMSSKQILADMKVLRAGSSNAQYDRVMEKWNEHYSDDLRLYATYSGGETEGDYFGATSVLNKLAEFRIMEVSGNAGHLNVAGDSTSSDGSVVTFMAACTLPTAYTMNGDDAINNGGWSSSILYKNYFSKISAKFSSNLTNNIKAVSKLNNAGGGAAQSAAGTTTTDKFWLMSYSEMKATGSQSSGCPTGEGTPYQWCKDNNIDGTGYNNSLTDAISGTRGDEWPGGLESQNSAMQVWLRSPCVSNTKNFVAINTYTGVICESFRADRTLAVNPAFCF